VIAGEGGPPIRTVDSLTAYFNRLTNQGISVNLGTYFSEAQARGAILGAASRAPNPDELTRMKAIMEKAMKAGALGMTTALIYPPGSYATTDELVEVAKVAAQYGGIYASHIRGEGSELLDAVEEAIEIGERAGLPVEIFHLKAAYKPGWGTLMGQAGKFIDASRARGVDVAADLYPYTAGGTGLEATIASWAHEGGTDSLRARLARPETRQRLKNEIRTGSPGWWNIIEAAGGWNGVVLVNARNPENARFENRSIAQIARETGRDPADVAFDLVAQGRGRVMAIYHMMGEEDIETALRFPWTSIGSDAGAASRAGTADGLGLPHPRSYGTFPRVIARYVKERKVLTLEDAIRKMTGWPATRMRLPERGFIREGLHADVTIFDLERLADKATYDKPTESPEGIDYVIVNGKITIERGAHTGVRAGHVLYGPGRQAAPAVNAASGTQQ
jgi:N-acyl-D-aspartate/D-glutamate deacylase